jgi:hypothetical protein
MHRDIQGPPEYNLQERDRQTERTREGKNRKDEAGHGGTAL